MKVPADDHRQAAEYAWSTGQYLSMAPNLPPAIDRLVSVVGVDPGARVLDVGS